MYQHIKLTEEQARSMYGQELAPGWSFLMHSDINEEYFLDPFQAESCINPDFQWLKEMPLSEYVPYDAEAQLQGSGSVNF
jgi:hypothetical protein